MTDQHNFKIFVAHCGAKDTFRFIFKGGSGCDRTFVLAGQTLNPETFKYYK